MGAYYIYIYILYSICLCSITGTCIRINNAETNVLIVPIYYCRIYRSSLRILNHVYRRDHRANVENVELTACIYTVVRAWLPKRYCSRSLAVPLRENREAALNCVRK